MGKTAVAGSRRGLSKEASALISDPGNELFFSAVNIWEIAIKQALRRPDFVADPHLLRRSSLEAGYTELSITSEHAIAVRVLPPIHKDPFDRMLAAQATFEGVLLLTADRTLASYGGPIRLV